MRLRQFILLCVITVPTIVFAQAWSWQNPAPNGNALSSVWWIDANTAWAVGAWGNAVQTTDGGATWKVRSIQPGVAFNKIIFTSTSAGWALGTGSVMRTSDGGATWTAANTGIGGGTASDASWSGTSRGWIVGSAGLITRTTDGGATWARQNSGTGQQLLGVSFINTTTGYTCGASGTILKTTNGGTQWTKLTINTTALLRDISAIDEFNAIVVGDGGRIYGTHDRGVSWQALNSQTTRNLLAVSFSDFFRGVAVGEGGTIRLTEDGGATWNIQLISTTENLQGVNFANAQRWACVGTACQILTSEDGGRNWNFRSSGPTTEWLDVDFVDSLYGWVVGRGSQIMRTTNGGASWTNVSPASYHNINGVSFVNRNTGWAVGDTAYILHTTNGGASWGTENLPIITKMNLLGVKFSDDKSGWICGSSGTYLFRTSNGGTSWVASYTQITGTVTLRRLAVNGPSVCAVGTGGVIYHTFDGGSTWKKQTSGTGQTLNGVSFPTVTRGIVVGNGGTVLTTVDGGATWVPVNAGTAQNLNGVVMHADSSARACGTGGALMRSTDWGASWQFAQPQPTSNTINSVALPTGRSAFAVGQYGSILKSYQPQSALSTSRRAVHFDSIQVATCDSLRVTVFNVGDDTVSVLGATLSGIDSMQFVVTPLRPLPVLLQRGDSVAMYVRFCPPDTGFRSVKLTITNSSPSSSLSLEVDGYAGALSFTNVDSLDFKQVAVGDLFDTTCFIKNTGSIPLHLKSLSIVGADSAMFTFNGQFFGASIEPAESLQVRFIFLPTAAGPRSATAVFATNADRPVRIVLHGNDVPTAVGDPVGALLPDLDLAVRPIPMNDRGTVYVHGASRGAAVLTLTDVLGRTLWQTSLQLSGTALAVPVAAGLQTGTYVLTLRTAQGTVARRFVVAH